MNINQVKYFVSSFEHSSFSLAAKSRGVTVQAVSKAINDLEREVGVKLFTRANRSISATEAGVAFYQKARVAAAAFRELEAFPGEAGVPGDKVTRLRIALCAPAFQGSGTLTKSMSRLIRERVGIEVDYFIVDPRTVAEDMRRGSVDALVTIGVLEREGVACTPVGKLPTGIMISRDHPLAAKRVVSVADLAGYPAAMSPWYDTFNKSILVMYRDAGLIENIRPVESLDASNRLLMEEQGYYFSAMYPWRDEEGNPLTLRPIDPAEGIAVPICIASVDGVKSPQYETVMRYLAKLPALLSGKGGGAAK